MVVGAGPTGVEFTAELRDFIEDDVPKYYPHLLPVCLCFALLCFALCGCD